jgi:hypothetical protein
MCSLAKLGIRSVHLSREGRFHGKTRKRSAGSWGRSLGLRGGRRRRVGTSCTGGLCCNPNGGSCGSNVDCCNGGACVSGVCSCNLPSSCPDCGTPQCNGTCSAFVSTACAHATSFTNTNGPCAAGFSNGGHTVCNTNSNTVVGGTDFCSICGQSLPGSVSCGACPFDAVTCVTPNPCAPNLVYNAPGSPNQCTTDTTQCNAAGGGGVPGEPPYCWHPVSMGMCCGGCSP